MERLSLYIHRKDDLSTTGQQPLFYACLLESLSVC